MAGEGDGGARSFDRRRPEFIEGLTTQRWTPERVRELLADPLYVGLGPFPRVISDDVWIESQVRRTETEGAESAVRLVLQNFAAWFGGETPGRCREPFVPGHCTVRPSTVPKDQGLVEGASSYVEEARVDPEGAFRRLLADLRAAAVGMTTGKMLKEWSSSQSGEESG